METKICKRCGRELPLSEFYETKSCKDGHINVCKECLKQYYQEHKEEKIDYQKQYYQNNKEDVLEQRKEYYQDNKDSIAERKKKYYQTPIGRASTLVRNYKWNDKKCNRGKCTLTVQWIIDNIFSGQKCIFCGESDWEKLGCDGIDNSLPHTPDNVNPCCDECNKKRGRKEFEEFLSMI